MQDPLFESEANLLVQASQIQIQVLPRKHLVNAEFQVQLFQDWMEGKQLEDEDGLTDAPWLLSPKLDERMGKLRQISDEEVHHSLSGVC